MKITFKYSSGIVTGECVIEDESRFIMHAESAISYPIVSTCADEFYGCISAADSQLREHMDSRENSRENKIDITTFSDQERKTL